MEEAKAEKKRSAIESEERRRAELMAMLNPMQMMSAGTTSASRRMTLAMDVLMGSGPKSAATKLARSKLSASTNAVPTGLFASPTSLKRGESAGDVPKESQYAKL